MTDLPKCIAAVAALNLPSAAKHVLIVLLARQHADDQGWPGNESLAIDTSIPQSLVERSVTTLRQKGLIRVFRDKDGEYAFEVMTRVLHRVAYSRWSRE